MSTPPATEVQRLRAELAAFRERELSLSDMAEELRESLRELADIKRALDESAIVAITDRRGVITYVNDKFVEISGYTRSELLGNSHQIINSGFHPKSFFQDLWRTINGGQVWRGELKNRRKSGAFYWVHTTIVPFLDEHGRPYQHVAIRTDITERKEAEEKLRLAQDELLVQKLFAERLSALAALAGGIAHELNQPLSGIRVYAELLQDLASRGDTLDPVRVTQTMAKIMRQVDRASRVISHMRDFACEQTDTSASSVELRQVAASVLELIGEQMRNHGIVCVNGIEPGVCVYANFNRLEQVLINLLSNARDSIEEKSQPRLREIRLGSSVGSETITVSVRDSGAGVPEMVRLRLFEPFVTTKRAGIGTGLGLSICHGIMRDFKGRIYLARSDEHGAEFHLEFPRIAP